MAWKWKVANKAPNYSGGAVTVVVQFYDSAEPTTILHTATESFEAWQSLAELQSRVKQIGSEERRKRSQVDALLLAIPVGAEGDV